MIYDSGEGNNIMEADIDLFLYLFVPVNYCDKMDLHKPPSNV